MTVWLVKIHLSVAPRSRTEPRAEVYGPVATTFIREAFVIKLRDVVFRPVPPGFPLDPGLLETPYECMRRAELP